MNKVVTTKEEVLAVAKEIVSTQGMEHLSIRTLAKQLDIAVGSIYNYFPSKTDLVLAIVEDFWKTVFHKDICEMSEKLCFPDFYELVYHRLSSQLESFRSIFLGQLEIMKGIDRKRGKALEESYLIHMRKGFLYALKQDQNISSHIWTKTFTQERFIEFIFENMLNDLGHQRKDCTYMKEIIQRIINNS